jgi:hypothetical protein
LSRGFSTTFDHFLQFYGDYFYFKTFIHIILLYFFFNLVIYTNTLAGHLYLFLINHPELSTEIESLHATPSALTRITIEQ